MTIPKVKILAPQVIQENFEYTLKCKIDDTKEQKIQIKWLDDNDVILLNVRKMINNSKLFFF